ncbi:MAG: PAS domain-containing protein, partial [Deltaproteobacteria bacterium]|nr:PAS domain-containing protein [Deltaproteobacteria bacterium]
MATLDEHGADIDYRLLMENLTEPVFVLDERTAVIFCNEAGAALFRSFHSDGVIGQVFAEYLHPQDRQIFEEGLACVRRTGAPFSAEFRVSVD